MSDKFNKRFRISSTRLQNWNYGWNAVYFVTICSRDREEYFGKIKNGKMILSNIGVLANVFWYEIKNHFAYVELDEFVVMPNHVHGILTIKKPEHEIDKQFDQNNDKNCNVDETVETRHALSLQSAQKTTLGQKRYQNPGKNNLSTIIGSYKSAVTKHARRLGYEFGWQSRFYDRIIRNTESLIMVQKYILDNVVNWDNDKFNDNTTS